MPKIDIDSVLVRTCRDGSFIIEDDDQRQFHEWFRIRLAEDSPDVIRQICEIANHFYAQGKSEGRAEIKDEFRRLMGIIR
jgi:hypothetical protein